jgi:hypothetical protein
VKGMKTPKKYPYKGKMLQMAEILALPECTKSRNSIRTHLLKGKTLEQIFAIETCPAKAMVEAKEEAAKAKAEARAKERERIKAIMAVPVNPRYTSQHYIKKTPKGNDGIVEPVRLKQNGWIG